MVLITHLRLQAVAPPVKGSPTPVKVAPAGHGRVVASFTAPGSGSPTPVEVAPAGLCRVVASFFSAPGSGSPTPVEVAPAGICRVASFFSWPRSCLLHPPAFCGPVSALASFFRPRWPWFVRIDNRLFTVFHDYLTLIVLTRFLSRGIDDCSLFLHDFLTSIVLTNFHDDCFLHDFKTQILWTGNFEKRCARTNRKSKLSEN